MRRTAARVPAVSSQASLRDLFSSSGATFELTVSEPSLIEGQPLVDKATISAKKYVVLSKARKLAAKPGKHKLTFKVAKKARKKLAKLRKLSLVVRLTITDVAGNRRVINRNVTLKRK